MGDSEAYLLAAMRQFPHWASDLFEHPVTARAVESLPAAADLDAVDAARLMERMQSAAAQVLLRLEQRGG